jgi:short-subunit dehydrogenase
MDPQLLMVQVNVAALVALTGLYLPGMAARGSRRRGQDRLHHLVEDEDA